MDIVVDGSAEVEVKLVPLRLERCQVREKILEGLPAHLIRFSLR